MNVTGLQNDNPVDADDQPRRPHLRIKGLKKSYIRNSGEVVPAIDDVDLEVMRGELVVLLGPSGCGKTTLLRSIAGLEVPESGSIELADRTIYSSSERTNVATERRNINMMFQSYALWPHMTVWKNVAYPVRTAKLGKVKVRELTDRVLENVNISNLAMQYPAELSGGQQQRVALARALVDEPETVLFDEPLSNVDAQVRETLRLEILRMHRELGFTAIYVTHDQTEAMQLADRIVIMREGHVEQQGSPYEVYRFPKSLYVSNFIGISNSLEGQVTRADDGAVTMTTEIGELSARPSLDIRVSSGETVHAIIRPEDFEVGRGKLAAANSWCGTVVTAMFAGPSLDYVIRLNSGSTIRASVTRADMSIVEGDDVVVSVEPGSVHLVAN